MAALFLLLGRWRLTGWQNILDRGGVRAGFLLYLVIDEGRLRVVK